MKRYQDYVIKDGKFIGKFEEMYQKFEDPWHQMELEFNVLGGGILWHNQGEMLGCLSPRNSCWGHEA